MTKVYYSGTNIAFSVYSEKCPNVRLHFEPTGTYRYVFMTDSKDLQNAMEKHEWFNEKFFLGETIDDKTATPSGKTEGTVAQDEVETITTVKVSGLAEAKDFLAENFGVARTNLRTKTAIENSAKDHNIEFVFSED